MIIIRRSCDIICETNLLLIFKSFFYLVFIDMNKWHDSRGREGDHLYSSLPLPLAHEHSDIYFQLCIWDDYRRFSIAVHAISRLILDEIYLPLGISVWLNVNWIQKFLKLWDWWHNHQCSFYKQYFVFPKQLRPTTRLT